jgi:hypothetical protein
MRVVRTIKYHFGANQWFLSADPNVCYGSGQPGDINRWTQAGLCATCLPCGFSDGDTSHFSNPISQAQLFADFEALANSDWPAPPVNAESFEEWRVEPSYDEFGNITVPNDIAVLPASPCGILTEYYGGDINGFWEDPLTTTWVVRWWDQPSPVPGITKSKAQIRHDRDNVPRTICLYEVRLDPPSSEKFNCRQVILEPGVWVDVPAPPFNHRTMIDVACQCLPPQ